MRSICGWPELVGGDSPRTALLSALRMHPLWDSAHRRSKLLQSSPAGCVVLPAPLSLIASVKFFGLSDKASVLLTIDQSAFWRMCLLRQVVFDSFVLTVTFLFRNIIWILWGLLASSLPTSQVYSLSQPGGWFLTLSRNTIIIPLLCYPCSNPSLLILCLLQKPLSLCLRYNRLMSSSLWNTSAESQSEAQVKLPDTPRLPPPVSYSGFGHHQSIFWVRFISKWVFSIYFHDLETTDRHR